jgi:hypothetical protein
MKQMINISHMFQDDTFESYNFFLADNNDVYQVGIENDLIVEYRNLIEERMKEGKSHLVIKNAVHMGEEIFEIQWG